jgi:hypothetical protein
MFFSTRENIEKNTGLNEHYQRKAMKTLTDNGILKIVKKGCPAKNYYSIDFNKLYEILTTSPARDEELSPARDEELEVDEVNDYIKQISKTNKKTKNNNSTQSVDTNNSPKQSNTNVVTDTDSFLGSAKSNSNPNIPKSLSYLGSMVKDVELQNMLVAYYKARNKINSTRIDAVDFNSIVASLLEIDTDVEHLKEIVQRAIKGNGTRPYRQWVDPRTEHSFAYKSNREKFGEGNGLKSEAADEDYYKAIDEFGEQLKAQGLSNEF